jgi:hypothetical protein
MAVTVFFDRKSRKRREAKSMATMSRPSNPTRVVLGEEISDCGHGSTLVEPERVVAVNWYVERLNNRYEEIKNKHQSGNELDGHRREGMQANFEVLEQFWSERKHVKLIDAKMIRFIVAYATESSLGGDRRLSYRLALLGTYLATWFKLGKDPFLEALRGKPVASSNQETMMDFQASMAKIGTERGLGLFLSKQIPCSCLDEDKKNAKETPKTGRCSYCNSEDRPKTELKRCSQCKAVHYCSKECQVKDWKAGHKKDCVECKRENEMRAAFKAQMRR